MQLTTEDGTELSEPTPEQLKTALTRLGLPGNGFAILARSEQVYLQCSGSRADGYIVEYRDGGEQNHYTSRQDDISHATMVELFTAYANGGRWQQMVKWNKAFAQQNRGKAKKSDEPRLTALLILFLIIGITMIATALYQGNNTYRFLQNAVEVPGRVIEMISYRGSSNETMYKPVVEYRDHLGKVRQVTDVTSANPPAYFVDEEVTVLYEPADKEFPLHAKIRSFVELWGLVAILLLAGTMFVVMPMLFLWPDITSRGRTSGKGRRTAQQTAA